MAELAEERTAGSATDHAPSPAGAAPWDGAAAAAEVYGTR
jgi:hypothetical protein